MAIKEFKKILPSAKGVHKNKRHANIADKPNMPETNVKMSSEMHPKIQWLWQLQGFDWLSGHGI